MDAHGYDEAHRSRVVQPWRDPVIRTGVIAVVAASLLAVAAIRIRLGTFAYPLDDAYIHMATARQLVENGNWGVTADGFGHVSSSPLWTLLLAASYAVTGVHHVTPLLLNLLAGLGAVVAVAGLVPQGSTRYRRAVVVGVLLAAPLSTMVVLGMEHTLHIALAALTFRLLRDAVSADARPGVAGTAWLAAAVFLMTAARYEGLFMAGAAAGLLVLRRRVVPGAVVLAAAVAPVAIMGAFAVANGAHILPNSVSLKGDATPALSLVGLLQVAYRLVFRTFVAPGAHTMLLVAAPVWWWHRGRRGESVWSPGRVATALWLITAVGHVAFARLGWFYRYETYLLVIAMVLVLDAAHAGWPAWRAAWSNRAPTTPRGRALWVPLLIVVLLVAPVAIRGLVGAAAPPRGAEFIHTQQRQTAWLLAEYYEGEAVAINDIGAPAFYADLDLLDTWGIASQDVADRKLAGNYTTAWLAQEATARGVQVAIVYDFWLDPFGGTPASWRHIGNWSVQEGPLQQRWVSIYAVADGHDDEAMANLCAFTPRLPHQVTVAGAYLEHPDCAGVAARTAATVVGHDP